MQESWNPSVHDLQYMIAFSGELEIGDSAEDSQYRAYVGNVLNNSPSGKFYMPLSSNVSTEEAEADEKWQKELDATAAKAGLWFHAGEGDSCDMILCGSPESYKLAWKAMYESKCEKLKEVQEGLVHVLAMSDERMSKLKELSLSIANSTKRV